MSQLIALFTLVFINTWAQADQIPDQRPDHFQGKPSETMEQAFQNLAQYNKKMEALLNISGQAQS